MWVEPARPSALILVLLLTTLLGLLPIFRGLGELQQGIYVEAWGTVFDILIVGVILTLYEIRRDRKESIERYFEEIDDFKKWNSEEGRLRIAGAVRRLNRFGKTGIDFGGIEISDFAFRSHDIRSIKGSTFYDGTWGEMGSRDQVLLERVDFSYVDCSEVIFSKFHPLAGLNIDIVFASIKDCVFVEAELSKAIFNGAYLEWTSEHPEDLGVWHEFADEPPSFQQTHYPPFWNANLKAASFVDATFKNADFRGAEDILACNFSGAKGLETSLFDDDDTREAVLRMSQVKGKNLA